MNNSIVFDIVTKKMKMKKKGVLPENNEKQI